jgi:hypothetical protein
MKNSSSFQKAERKFQAIFLIRIIKFLFAFNAQSKLCSIQLFIASLDVYFTRHCFQRNFNSSGIQCFEMHLQD